MVAAAGEGPLETVEHARQVEHGLPPVTTPTRVVACTAGGGTRLEERAPLAPGPGELVLDLIACGLCGTDLFKLVNATEPAGTVLGHELVGRVAAVGSGVTFARGERLVVPHHVACGDCHLCRAGSETKCPEFQANQLAPGGFASRVLVRARAVATAAWRVPDTVSDAAATFMEPAACVLRGIRRSGLGRDGSALVVGAGSMGLLHLLVLRALAPALRVVVSDPLPERQRLARELGAVAACGVGADELARATAEVAGGDGVDAVFDTVGGARVLAAGRERLRLGGTLVLFAHAGDGELAAFDLNAFFKAEQRLVATYSGALAEQREVASLLVSGALDPTPLVSHTLPLSRFAEAVDLARRRRALKILLEPDLP